MSSSVVAPTSIAPESSTCDGTSEKAMSSRLVGGPTFVATEPPDVDTAALVYVRRPSFAETQTTMCSPWTIVAMTDCVTGSSSR